MLLSGVMKGPTKAQLREAAQTMSRKGNHKGGVNRWAGVSAEERRETARAAAKARWDKRRAKGS